MKKLSLLILGFAILVGVFSFVGNSFATTTVMHAGGTLTNASNFPHLGFASTSENVSVSNFGGGYNIIEEGDLVVSSTTTLQLETGVALVFNPGYNIKIKGKIAMASGASIKKGYLWAYDGDGDTCGTNIQYTEDDVAPGASDWFKIKRLGHYPDPNDGEAAPPPFCECQCSSGQCCDGCLYTVGASCVGGDIDNCDCTGNWVNACDRFTNGIQRVAIGICDNAGRCDTTLGMETSRNCSCYAGNTTNRKCLGPLEKDCIYCTFPNRGCSTTGTGAWYERWYTCNSNERCDRERWISAGGRCTCTQGSTEGNSCRVTYIGGVLTVYHCKNERCVKD